MSRDSEMDEALATIEATNEYADQLQHDLIVELERQLREARRWAETWRDRAVAAGVYYRSELPWEIAKQTHK